MKKLAIISVILLSALSIISCGNNTQKRIVSKTPIKAEVLGLTLCNASSEDAIEDALSKATEKLFYTQSEKTGNATTVRAFPLPAMVSQINYGALSWHYVDVILNKDKKITEIRIVASFENIDRAKEQYDTACLVLSQKYGKGNANDEYQTTFWTDDTNSVGVNYVKSSALDGSDRCFCTMYYVNRELANEAEKESTPDV